MCWGCSKRLNSLPNNDFRSFVLGCFGTILFSLFTVMDAITSLDDSSFGRIVEASKT